MDEVALVPSGRKEIQNMLNIVNDISKRYHIEFGKDKSIKGFKNGGKAETEPFKLEDMEIGKYKYLGEIQNKNNLSNQILENKRKAEASYQTVMTVTWNKSFKGI